MTDKTAAFSFKLSRLDRIVDKIVSPDKDTMTKSGKKASSTGDVAAAAAAPQAAKRMQDDEESSEGDAGEAEWQLEIRKEIVKEAGLTEEQVAKVMGIVMKAFKLRVTEEARKVAMHADGEDQDVRKSGNSIIIHRAEQWVAKESGQLNLNLAEKVTMAVHRMAAGSVAVLDAFTLGRWDAASPPTAVLLTLGSRSQENTFFKIFHGGGSPAKMKRRWTNSMLKTFEQIL